jgi:hypothetical protein
MSSGDRVIDRRSDDRSITGSRSPDPRSPDHPITRWVADHPITRWLLNLLGETVSELDMRLRRGVAGRVLACGCLVGIYETYEGSVVATIDAKGPACPQAAHVLHQVVVEASVEPGGEVGAGSAGSARSAGSHPPNVNR